MGGGSVNYFQKILSMEWVNFSPFFKQVQKMSDTEVPTEFHAKDAQFLAEQEFMEVIINCPDYFSSPVFMQHTCVNVHPFCLLSQASESMSSLFALEMKVRVQKYCHHLSSKCSHHCFNY